MAELTSPSRDPWAALRARVTQQSNYLRNPLPPGSGVCDVCRGPAAAPFLRCFPCSQHRSAASGRTANAVVPIAYGLKGEQHYQNLVAYKARTPAVGAQTRLRDLALLFLRTHWRCLTTAAGGRFSHLAVVPSTSGRAGLHPLAMLLAPRIPLPMLTVVTNPAYLASDRSFHADRFQVDLPELHRLPNTRVLVLEDTWTTGSRVQSLAYALREAGAAAVIAVVLGRLINPEYPPSGELLRRVAKVRFEIARCGLAGCEQATRDQAG